MTTDTGAVTLPAQVRVLQQKVSKLWGDLYGDTERHDAGLIQEQRGLARAVNRLAIAVVFFALVALINLVVNVWTVLAI